MAETNSLPHEPLVLGSKSLAQVTDDVCNPLDRKTSKLWWCAFGVSTAALLLGFVTVAYQISTGIGTWGLNRTVGWAFDITNFVFWVGIGHAGTLISAILFLFLQKWRTAVNRSAEAMTLFAVMCAGVFPLIHMGRPWLAFWMAPWRQEVGNESRINVVTCSARLRSDRRRRVACPRPQCAGVHGLFRSLDDEWRFDDVSRG